MTEYKALSAFEQVSLQKQVEELQARIAMQDEVISGTVRVCEARGVRRATSEDVAAWQEKRDKEVVAKALEDAAKVCLSCCAGGVMRMAAELRGETK